MLKLKKGGLTGVFEQDTNNNPYVTEETPSQPVYDVQQTTNVVTSIQPRPTTSEPEWGDLLIKFLATAPEDVALKLVSCLDSDLIAKLLEEKKNDPYLKVALLLLTHKK
jgi:hypothetical protein